MTPDRIEPDAGGGMPSRPAAGDFEQRLSCLLDGELEAGECRALLERLRRDEEACRRWSLLGCVGDAMRSAEVASWHSDGFVSRVASAIEREPTVLAPSATKRGVAARRWLVPGAGVAAAAALLMAIGLPTQRTAAPDSSTVRAPLPSTNVAAVAAPGQIERSPALERYLAAHRELADPTLMPSSTPYVRTSAVMPATEAR